MVEPNVNVAARRKEVHRRVNGADKMPSSVHVAEVESSQPDSPFPYLETILTIAKRYPYSALMAMIAIASVVISAVVVLSVSVIGGMFLMYGEMRQNTASMRENQATMVLILNKQQTIENRQIDSGNIMRAYMAHNGEKVGMIVGLLTPDKQRAINSWDKAHPAPQTPKEEN